jgi:hypothetical protein
MTRARASSGGNTPLWTYTRHVSGQGACNGDIVSIECWAWDDPVGPFGNRQWWYQVADLPRGPDADGTYKQLGDNHFLGTPRHCSRAPSQKRSSPSERRASTAARPASHRGKSLPHLHASAGAFIAGFSVNDESPTSAPTVHC